MIIIKRRKVIAYTKYSRNLLVFDPIKLEKAIIIGHKKSIYIISKYK